MAYDTKEILTSNGKHIPQLYNPATDAYEPLQGSAAGGMRTILYDGSGNPLLTDANPASVKLTGRKVEEVTAHNALAITTNAFISSAEIDVSMYKSISFLVVNTLDQPVEVFLLEGGDLVPPGTTFSYDGTTLSEKKVTVASSAVVRNVIDRTAFKSGDVMPKKIKISLHCAVAPISGSVTVVLWGVPN